MRRLLGSVLLCIFSINSFAQGITAEIPPKNEESVLFAGDKKAEEVIAVKVDEPTTIKPKHFILPAALIGAGSFTLVKELKGINTFAKEQVWKQGTEEKFKVDHYTIGVPALAVYGLNAAGIKGKNNFVDRTMILAMSSAVSNGVVFTAKRLTGIERPDGSDMMSFPSGHTAQAFVTAEFMRQEYKDVSPWYGVGAYAFAAGNGLLRMYHDKHWLGDVIAGAGVGIASTRLSYWLYPKIKKGLFPKSDKSIVVAPLVNNGTYGASLVYSF
jgi:hypothetical protein